MTGFVIEFNRRTRERRVTKFEGPDGHLQALRRRIELEATRTDPNLEIASLTSDSLESVRHTHSRYFEGDLAGV